jgi:hypothetical protein
MASDASNPPAPDKDRAPAGVTTTGPQFDEALQAAEVLLRRADSARVTADRVLAAEAGIAAGAYPTTHAADRVLPSVGEVLGVALPRIIRRPAATSTHSPPCHCVPWSRWVRPGGPAVFRDAPIVSGPEITHIAA